MKKEDKALIEITFKEKISSYDYQKLSALDKGRYTRFCDFNKVYYLLNPSAPLKSSDNKGGEEILGNSTSILELCRESLQGYKDELKRNGGNPLSIDVESFNTGFMNGYFQRKVNN